MKCKTVKWFTEGDKIPYDAKLIQTKEEYEMKRPSEGGELRPIYTTKFLYEYEVEE